MPLSSSLRKVHLKVQTLTGHQRDAEAYLIIAWDSSVNIQIRKLFPQTEPMGVSEFFRKLAEIADRIEDTILPYEVVEGQ